ncbi:MAG: transposase, partial [Planctomycetota bacterium]
GRKSFVCRNGMLKYRKRSYRGGDMAYRYGNRNQITLLPPSIEEYVRDDAPVRAYDAMISAMDFNKLGIEINPNSVGNTAYDPKAMVKLLVDSYSDGVRSSRKIEREANYNLSSLWLTGGLKPDHKTIREEKNKSGDAVRTHKEESGSERIFDKGI